MGIIRDIARKNYTIYCVQENLLDLKATQMAQKKLMDDIEEFKEVKFKKIIFSICLIPNIKYFSIFYRYANHCLVHGN